MTQRILVVGAHPDDFELGCAGAIAKHRTKGDLVYGLVLTKGEKGGSPELRIEEGTAAAKVLGLTEIYFADFGDGYVKDDHKTVNFIEDFIKKLNIDRIYTHYPMDRHQDHRKCSLAVSSAARKVPEILLYSGPATHNSFEPHFFIKLSEEDMRKKMESLNCHKSQVEKGIVDLRWVEGMAIVTGALCNTQYAEAFALNHMIVD